MGTLRNAVPPEEKWNAAKLAEHLKIDIKMAKAYFKQYHDQYGGGYGDIEKTLILDFVNQKQREEREREARYQSDLANVESTATLKEQVKTLQKQVVVLNDLNASSDRRARSSNMLAVLSLIIATCALAVAIIDCCLKY